MLLERLLEIRLSLTSVLGELQWDNLPMSEWKCLQNIHTLLKPFAQYMMLISGVDYYTVYSSCHHNRDKFASGGDEEGT